MLADGVQFVHGSNSASLEGVCRFRALLSMEDIDRTPWFHRNGRLRSGERGYTINAVYTGQPVAKGVSMYPVHMAHACLNYSEMGLTEAGAAGLVYPLIYGLQYERQRLHHAYLDGSIDHPLTQESVNIDHIVRIYVPPLKLAIARTQIQAFGLHRLAQCVRPCDDLAKVGLRRG